MLMNFLSPSHNTAVARCQTTFKDRSSNSRHNNSNYMQSYFQVRVSVVIIVVSLSLCGVSICNHSSSNNNNKNSYNGDGRGMVGVQSFQLLTQPSLSKVVRRRVTLNERREPNQQHNSNSFPNTKHRDVTASNNNENIPDNRNEWMMRSIRQTTISVLLVISIVTTTASSGLFFGNINPSTIANAASDPNAIVGCLFQKCSVQLGKCIASPLCLANVVCINTCNNRPDEIECQIKCGDIFDNPAIAEFNKCAVSDMSCVPQQQDTGMYPIPSRDTTVAKFNTNFFNGRLYITAGQNPLFDIFPCQVHFFTETEPGKFFGKLNWRVTEPDGEYFTRDALQEFYQDPNDPSHLINHDNEYLHYKDDWWIIDYEYENNDKGLPPFAFVYYRGSNDAWDGYGGVVVYTRDAALPKVLLPRLREASKKIHYDFDKDFTITDNSCPAELSDGEKVVLREKFAGKTLLQSEEQLQAAATRFRGNAVNSIKAQKLFFENRYEKANEAFATLEQSTKDFESEVKGTAAGGK